LASRRRLWLATRRSRRNYPKQPAHHPARRRKALGRHLRAEGDREFEEGAPRHLETDRVARFRQRAGELEGGAFAGRGVADELGAIALRRGEAFQREVELPVADDQAHVIHDPREQFADPALLHRGRFADEGVIGFGRTEQQRQIEIEPDLDLARLLEFREHQRRHLDMCRSRSG
jgi:hypothetical protein